MLCVVNKYFNIGIAKSMLVFKMRLEPLLTTTTAYLRRDVNVYCNISQFFFTINWFALHSLTWFHMKPVAKIIKKKF